jgi:hypothetical protein
MASLCVGKSHKPVHSGQDRSKEPSSHMDYQKQISSGNINYTHMEVNHSFNAGKNILLLQVKGK